MGGGNSRGGGGATAASTGAPRATAAVGIICSRGCGWDAHWDGLGNSHHGLWMDAPPVWTARTGETLVICLEMRLRVG